MDGLERLTEEVRQLSEISLQRLACARLTVQGSRMSAGDKSYHLAELRRAEIRLMDAREKMLPGL